MNKQKMFVILAVMIFLLAAFFRLYGVNWDQNQHLHPDERFLTMVTTGISWPKDIYEYFDAKTSRLNPQNRGFDFFVYGTFPIFLTKAVADFLILDDYTNVTLLGREMSAFIDLGIVVLVFLIAKQINPNFKAQMSQPKTDQPRAENQAQSASWRTKSKETRKKSFGFRIWDFFCHLDLEFGIFPLITMFLYACMVLPIQLSHFYAVDTYLTFFLTLSFFLGCKLIKNVRPISKAEYQISKIKDQKYILNIKNLIVILLTGVSFGFALASKISGGLFLPILLLFIIIASFQYLKARNAKFRIFYFLYVFLIFDILFFISTYFSFRFAQPYLFANRNIFDITPNIKVLNNWQQLKAFDDPTGWFPPGVQWIKTKPYFFPLKNMMLWGLGLPIGIISILGIFYFMVSWFHGFIVKLKRKQLPITNYQLPIILSVLWILLLFSYQGFQFVKALRYFYPIYPFLAIIGGYSLYRLLYQISNIKYQIYKSNIKNIKIRIFDFLYVFFIFDILFFILLYPVSFVSIYARPHTRIAASQWIYQNIPAGSVRSAEHWDDGLPVSLPIPGYINEKYPGVEFPLYGADTKEKWQEMDQKLQKTDYIILSSNRLYGSIMTFPERYPVTVKYYQSLFDGSLGFEKAAEFTSRPNLPIPGIKWCLDPPFIRYGIVAYKTQECSLPGISFVDDYADETFTVYDHPKVTIFKKVKSVNYFNFLYNSQPTTNN